jgi:hypothetical protein
MTDTTTPLSDALNATADITGTDVHAILAQRGKRYGLFKHHANITQGLKQAIYKHMVDHNVAGFAKLTPSMKEAIDMLCHKVGRIANGDPTYADSWVDVAGYTTLVAKELNGEIV